MIVKKTTMVMMMRTTLTHGASGQETDRHSGFRRSGFRRSGLDIGGLDVRG